MLSQLRAATTLLLALTIITGGIYPLMVTAISQTLFPDQAIGSLIQANGKIVGSNLIGQNFTRPEYFWGRISATGPIPYNAALSSGSNFGPLNPALKEAAEKRIAALKAVGESQEKIPVELVTASASGLDPHISPAAAEFQVRRVSAARQIAENIVRELVLKNTEGRQWGILGEPRVNVLQLNLALDRVGEGSFAIDHE